MTTQPVSFIDRLKSRMASNQGFLGPGLTPPPQPKEKSRKVIKTNRWDDRVWKEARKTESVDDLVEDLVIGDTHRENGHREGFEPAPELVEGLFQSFYKANPRLEAKRNLERELYPVRKILEEVADNPKLKELQEFTVNDPVMATVALDAMAEPLREIIGRIPPPPPPPQPGGKKKKGGGKGQGEGQGEGEGEGGEGQGEGQPSPGEGQGEGGSQGAGGASPGDDFDPGEGDGSEVEEDLTGEGDDEFDPDSEDAMNQAEAEWEAEFDAMLDDLDLDRMANKMLDAAEREASELDNLRKGIGLEDGEWHSMNPEERLAFAERLRTPEMKALSEVIGQMKRFALGVKATRVNDVPHEAYDVETGDDLRRTLRAQFALLGHKDTTYEFYRRYLEKELLVYKMRGTEEVGKGPIVIAIDKSGSMGGSPFMWAMGVAEALRRFAADEDRDYYAMFFGNNNDRERFDFPEGKGPFEKVMSFLGTQANGGTQFDGVLTEALEKATKDFDKSGKDKADIIFITDGQSHLDETWIERFNAERNRVGVRVYSVYIGGAHDMTYQTGPVGLLNKISDVVIPVSDLKPESVKRIFEKV